MSTYFAEIRKPNPRNAFKRQMGPSNPEHLPATHKINEIRAAAGFAPIHTEWNQQ